jgi:hypothetical protein
MRARRGDLSASAAVLGLLVEQPDCIAGLARRLSERFPQAGFSRNAVHKALPSLHNQGLVLVVERGRLRSLDLWQASEVGCRSYREALRASAAALPAVPDALRAWLEQVGDEAQLCEVVGVIEQLEAGCAAEYVAARKLFRASAQLRALRGTTCEGWQARVDRALMVDNVAVWGWHARRLQRLRVGLEFSVDLDEDEGDDGEREA